MKLYSLFLMLVLATGLPAAEIEENPPEELAVSATGDLRVMARRGVPDKNSDGELTVWVESGEKRADLPPSPLAVQGSGEGDSWSLLILPSIAMSSDGRWLFATQKVCTGYCIGYLYQRKEGIDFQIATNTRFDALVWRFFAKTEGVNIEKMIASDSPAHLIDFAGFGDRYLAVALRGAVENVPAAKKVASNPENNHGATGIYDWQCFYDLREGRFVLPDTLKAHNAGAWRRWADITSASDNKDISQELDAAFQGLLVKLDAPAQKKLREEQRDWLAKRDQKSNDPNFDAFDVTRKRALELEMRAVATTPRKILTPPEAS